MSKLPETQQSLSRWLRQRERTALRQRQTSAFARSGTSVTAEGAQSLDGTLTVTPGTGFVSIDGSLGVHGTAAFDGSTTIGGDLVVAGTLSLPNSIVPNAALATPVGVPTYVYDAAASFALTTTESIQGTYTAIVPAGRTSAVISVIARLYAANPNTTGGIGGTGGDYLYCRVHVTRDDAMGPATYGDAMKVLVPGNGAGLNTAPHFAVLTALVPGSHIVIDTLVSTSLLSWALSTDNETHTVGTIEWLA